MNVRVIFTFLGQVTEEIASALLRLAFAGVLLSVLTHCDGFAELAQSLESGCPWPGLSSVAAPLLSVPRAPLSLMFASDFLCRALCGDTAHDGTVVFPSVDAEGPSWEGVRMHTLLRKWVELLESDECIVQIGSSEHFLRLRKVCAGTGDIWDYLSSAIWFLCCHCAPLALPGSRVRFLLYLPSRRVCSHFAESWCIHPCLFVSHCPCRCF